jgi:hypothetical protein
MGKTALQLSLTFPKNKFLEIILNILNKYWTFLNIIWLLDKELFSSIGFDCWDDRRILGPDVEFLLWSSSYCKWSNNNFRELQREPQLGQTKGLNPVEGKNSGWDELLADLWKQNYNSNTLNIFRFEWF